MLKKLKVLRMPQWRTVVDTDTKAVEPLRSLPDLEVVYVLEVTEYCCFVPWLCFKTEQ